VPDDVLIDSLVDAVVGPAEGSGDTPDGAVSG